MLMANCSLANYPETKSHNCSSHSHFEQVTNAQQMLLVGYSELLVSMGMLKAGLSRQVLRMKSKNKNKTMRRYY